MGIMCSAVLLAVAVTNQSARKQTLGLMLRRCQTVMSVLSLLCLKLCLRQG